MKKICKITSLMMVLIIALGALTSCGRMFEGVQKKAEKAGYECELFESPRMISMSKAMKEAGVEGEMKMACPLVKDGIEHAHLYEFDKITTARAFEANISQIFTLGEDVVVARDNKVVIVGERATVEEVW